MDLGSLHQHTPIDLLIACHLFVPGNQESTGRAVNSTVGSQNGVVTSMLLGRGNDDDDDEGDPPDEHSSKLPRRFCCFTIVTSYLNFLNVFFFKKILWK